MSVVSNRLRVVVAAFSLGTTFMVPSLGLAGGAKVAFAATIPRCGGANFVGGWVGKNGATGTSTVELAFVNQGHQTCRLGGFATIQGYRNGREYPLAAGHLKSQVFDISPTIVGPQMSGEMVITTSGLCNALNSGNRSDINRVIAKNTYTVSVKFPHSNTAVDIFGLHIDVACGLNISAVGWR